jgi:hypothetical protein
MHNNNYYGTQKLSVARFITIIATILFSVHYIVSENKHLPIRQTSSSEVTAADNFILGKLRGDCQETVIHSRNLAQGLDQD